MIFDHKLYLLGVSFHTYTFIVLFCTLLVDLYYKLRQSINFKYALIHATALVTFTIHYYEVFHGSTEYIFTGFLSPSLYLLNIPSTIIACVVLFSIRRPDPNLLAIPILVVGLVVFSMLGVTGFYRTFPKNALWAISKTVFSLFSLALFTPGGSQ